MKHRSQDELVEALADRILDDERSAAALMEYFEGQMRPAGGPVRRRLAALWRGFVRALAAAGEVSGTTSGVPTNDPAARGGPYSAERGFDGWPWPW